MSLRDRFPAACSREIVIIEPTFFQIRVCLSLGNGQLWDELIGLSLMDLGVCKRNGMDDKISLNKPIGNLPLTVLKQNLTAKLKALLPVDCDV